MNIELEALQSMIKEAVLKQLANNTNSNNPPVPVGVSNRHIHLSDEHVEILFGPGYQLTPKKILMGKEYAAEEVVTIIGPSLRSIENVRVLGPVRKNTQVEISRTDSFVLKVKPPVRPSGEINGSAPMTIVGPKGVVHINAGCIIANRHIHMPPQDAAIYGLVDGDYVDVEVLDGERPTKFYDVQVRVRDDFRLEMHIDTDDANAAGISGKNTVTIVKKK